MILALPNSYNTDFSAFMHTLIFFKVWKIQYLNKVSDNFGS